jgi:chromatin remodeling complex protein RSC6
MLVHLLAALLIGEGAADSDDPLEEGEEEEDEEGEEGEEEEGEEEEGEEGDKEDNTQDIAGDADQALADSGEPSIMLLRQQWQPFTAGARLQQY